MNSLNNAELKWWQILWRGMVMGVADLVPGISGGTMALVLGIYPRFISALSQLSFKRLLELKTDGIKAVWGRIDGGFLCCLFIGILLSIFLLAQVIHFCLEQYPILLFAFFFGLVLASLPWLLKQVEHWNAMRIFLFIVGLSIGVAVSLLTPSGAESINQLWLLPAGALAISAMLLPGISGSFILLLLGLYAVLINAIKTFDFAMMSLFFTGAILGFLLFPKLLNYLLKHYYSATLALLVGIVTGALVKIWPWHIMQGDLIFNNIPVLPFQYTSALEINAMPLQALLFIILGAFIATLLLKIETINTIET